VTFTGPPSLYVGYVAWLGVLSSVARFAPAAWARPIVAAVAGLLVIPVCDTNGYMYLRGVFGELSVTHSLLAIAALVNLLARRAIILVPAAQNVLMSLGLMVTAVVFYPSALGATEYDLYRLGFNPQILLGILAAVALLGWCFRLYAVVIALSLAVVAWSQHLMESSNLWDYLFDPLLILCSAVWLCATAAGEAGWGRAILGRVSCRVRSCRGSLGQETP
jgi:hypothetical protein